MKKIYLLLLFVAAAFQGFSQTAASYIFSVVPGTTYTSIASAPGVVTASLACDDCNLGSIPIGFTFRFCGTNYTTLAASSNGFISLSNLSSAPFTVNATNITGPGFLMPYWSDLTGLGSPAPAAYYITTGSAPNRVFTFQWKNFLKTGTTWPANVQVKLYETTNAIEYCYGTFTNTITPASVGIANSTTDWQNLNTLSGTPVSSSSTFTNNPAGLPDSTQTFRWMPPCSGTPIAGTVSASLTAGCVNYTSLLTLTGGVPPYTPGISYEWKSSPNGTSWSVVPGATNPAYTATVTATVYYHIITSCSYSGLTNVTPPVLLSFNAPGAISGPDTICVGSTGTFSDTTSGGIWSSSNTGVAIIGAVGSVMGVSAGTVTITFTHGGCFATRSLYVSSGPDPGVITGNYLLCATPTTFTETVPGGTWGVTNTSIAGVSTGGAAYAILPGLDTITYTLSNTCGTSVTKFPVNTTPCLTNVNILNTAGMNIEVYPNPNNGTFTFKAASLNDEQITVSLTNLSGAQLRQFTTTTNKTTDLKTTLPAGMYFLTVRSKQGSAVVKVLVE